MKRNKSDYLVLAIPSALFVAGVYRFQTVAKYTLILTALYGLFYFCWGIFHESKRGNLYPRVVLEYLLVAILGVAIVSTLLI